MNVLVIPEDFRKDQYILKPLDTGPGLQEPVRHGHRSHRRRGGNP